ncbi:alpha/beta fold hydrolase [Aliikangiella coralliicola]|uniref:Alpha/beta hydrolase n=1 Tax=Aliikangiella coralliicola TaxID=2592383 RepID=A0A545U0I2_9GAMM|nr:alpha/beta hydrolase [Aliikangiella coralliicola]TQV82975.1 alpha/beta hydrolase [Aliikangiella coralliicola]
MIEYKLNLAGCQCSVVEWNPDGSILVFALHGWLDNLATFESLVEFMPDLRIVAIDFPGHGHSDHIPPGVTYHFVDGIYLIDDLLRHFEQKQINLLGHSMGGAISTLYAASLPDRVKAMVLIESIGPLTAKPEDGVSLLNRSVNQRAALAGKRKPVYTSFDQALTARADVSEVEKNLIKPLVERALVKVEDGYTWRADSRLRITSPVRMSEAHLVEVLSNIEAPVLLIEGEKGFITDSELLQTRKQSIQYLEVVQIPGGHHLHLEQPQTCAAQIQTFFQKIG